MITIEKVESNLYLKNSSEKFSKDPNLFSKMYDKQLLKIPSKSGNQREPSPKIEIKNQESLIPSDIKETPDPKLMKKPNLPVLPNMGMNFKSYKASQTSRSISSISTTPTIPKFPSQTNRRPSVPLATPHISKYGSTRSDSLSHIPKIQLNSSDSALDREINRKDEEIYLSSELDNFFLLLSHESLPKAVEIFVQERLNAGQVIFWRAVASVSRFYSYKFNMSVSNNAGLIGFAFQARDAVTVPIANKHEFYDPETDGKVINPTTSLVLFPLYDSRNNLISIIEVCKKANDPIPSKSDFTFIEAFQRKFRVFSHWIMNSENRYDEVYSELLHLMEPGQFILLFKRKMVELFDCREAEMWTYKTNATTTTIQCYSENGIKEYKQNNLGIVGEVIRGHQIFNCYLNTLQSSYNQEIDGEIEEPILAIPYTISDSISKQVFVIMIRGQKTQKIFIPSDEEKLAYMSKFIFSSFINSLFIEESNDHEAANDKLVQSLLKILPIVNKRKLPQDVLETSMKELKAFTKADRVTYFEIDRERDVLRSTYFDGTKDKYQVQIGTGQCGMAVKKGIVLNTANAYEDKIYDPSYDKICNYKTSTLLSVPLINSNGAVGAAIQLRNKQDFKPFSAIDIGAARIYGTVCMSLLSTSTLYAKVNDSLRRMEGLTYALNSLTEADNVEQAIVESARNTIQCEYLTFYKFDQAALSLNPIAIAIADRGRKRKFCDLSAVQGICGACISSKKSFYTNDVKNHESLANELPEEKKLMISVLICPVMNLHNKEIVGLIRAINKRGLFDDVDSTILQDYSILLSLITDIKKLRTINEKGPAQPKMDKWISLNEFGVCSIPQMLRLSDIKASLMTKLDFNTFEWNKSGTYRILFHVFGSFGLITKLKLTNTKLYSFIYYIKSEYAKHNVIFHNWKLCIEMTQFLSYMLLSANVINILPPKDIFSLVIALLTCFIQFDGTNNRYQIESETPFGLALPNDSILEKASIVRLIQLMSEDRTDLMSLFNNEDQKYIWKLIFLLIMNSDITRSTDSFEKAIERYQTTTLDLGKTEDREILILMLFRAALMSVYCRPFLISQKWHDLETEEMYLLGDKEEKLHINSTSEFHCRELNNKIEHAIDKFTNIVIPFYTILTKAIPDLAETFTTAKSNLKTWIHLKQTKNQNPQPQ